MSADNSQIGNTASAPLFENNENKFNLDQLLSNEIVITSQPLIQFTMANMIPSQKQLISHISEHENISRRQLGRRRRRQRRRQRRQQRTREQQEEQRRQHQRQHQQRQQPEPTVTRQRFRGWSEDPCDHEYWEYLGFPEYIEETDIEPLLAAYEWDKLDPKNQWEQKQLDETEEFAVPEQLALIQDELEQLQQIEVVQKLQQEEEEEQQQQQYQNRIQLIQVEQCDLITF